MYNPHFELKKYAVATLASHSALQILKGARDEGFKTIAVCRRGGEKPYLSFNSADEYLFVDKFSDFFQIEEELLKRNAIIIPHGSFVAYLGADRVRDIKMMHYGNKNILKWESDRKMEREWLTKAGLRLPKIFESPEEIDRIVIIKFDGADGGRGYFLAKSGKEFYEKIKEHPTRKYLIQEYIIGVPVYIHFFYSPITKELELMGFDRRYESNVDSIGRIAAKDQIDINLNTSYNITGNMPLVMRESLLPKIFKMGEAVVKVSQEIEPPGLFGPFCLETVLKPNLNFYVFEISARIVAGTNLYPNGSPYTALKYGVPMSTGRRIALDIKQAIKG